MSAPDAPGRPPPSGGPDAPASSFADDLGDLLAPHRLAALRVATIVLGTSEGADDVVQDAIERALRAAATYDPTQDVRPWFLRIVANTARNLRRTRGRRASLALRAGMRREAVDAGGGEQLGPEDAAVTAEDRQRVLDALNRLGDDDRLVIALRHFEQLSEHEMAVTMECPTGTVKSRLSRAMARLRSELAAGEVNARG